LLGVIAFAVDYGYLVKVRTDFLRAADAAALAATQDLIRGADGTQDLGQVRATAREYARINLDDAGFQIADSDIEIGRFDPETVYSSVNLLNNGTLDTVRVTLRRDGTGNPLVPLMFARVLGRQQASVSASATAALQKAEHLFPGADILPMATPEDLWNDMGVGETWNSYGDGRLKDSNGDDIPGHWGTLDVGGTDNSTNDLNDQILNGLRQSDLNAMYADDRIVQPTHLDSSAPTWMSGDTGLSVGVKNSILQVHGNQRLVPIYRGLNDTATGENLEYEIVRWGVVTLVDSEWQGAVNTRVILRKSHTYSGELHPKPSLSGGTPYIDGAFTSPVLIE
jgi:hypothetical protein